MYICCNLRFCPGVAEGVAESEEDELEEGVVTGAEILKGLNGLSMISLSRTYTRMLICDTAVQRLKLAAQRNEIQF